MVEKEEMEDMMEVYGDSLFSSQHSREQPELQASYLASSLAR